MRLSKRSLADFGQFLLVAAACFFPALVVQAQAPDDTGLYFRGDYLMWWTSAGETPPLVTAGTPASEGVLDQPGTEVLFGGGNMADDFHSGLRVQLGLWLDSYRTAALEGEYSGLGEMSDRFQTSFDAYPVLARPFVNALISLPDSELVAYPGQLAGSIVVEFANEVEAAGIRWRTNLGRSSSSSSQGAGWQLDGLMGYRYLGLDEHVMVREQLTSLIPIAPAAFDISDRFDTSTRFHGVDLGMQFGWERSIWSVDVLTKVAIGSSRQEVSVDGSTLRTLPTETRLMTGGLLAQRTNIGSITRNEFAVVPEVGVSLSCQLTERIRGTLGYTFLYLSRAARAGDQIDTVVNPNLLPPEADPFSGPLRPEMAFACSDFWAQGLSFGVECCW